MCPIRFHLVSIRMRPQLHPLGTVINSKLNHSAPWPTKNTQAQQAFVPRSKTVEYSLCACVGRPDLFGETRTVCGLLIGDAHVFWLDNIIGKMLGICNLPPFSNNPLPGPPGPDQPPFERERVWAFVLERIKNHSAMQRISYTVIGKFGKWAL